MMNVQFRASTRMAQAAARAVELWRKARSSSSSYPAQIAQVQYRAVKPYHLRYQPDSHDLTNCAKDALCSLKKPSDDAGAELVRVILSRKGRDCLFWQHADAAALFLESKEDPFGRFGIGGGCLDVVLDDGRSARYLFGPAEILPEPPFCTPTEAVIAASASPGAFERSLAQSRQLPAVPARWLVAHTKSVLWWLLAGASSSGALLLLALR